MYKGKYVLVSYSELKQLIESYLNINVDLVERCDIEYDLLDSCVNFFVQIKTKDLNQNKFNEILELITDDFMDNSLVESFYEYKDTIIFDMHECSNMLRKLFCIKEKIEFDNEVVFLNYNEDIILFYQDINQTEKVDCKYGK